MTTIKHLFQYHTSFRIGAALLLLILLLTGLSFFSPYEVTERRVVPKNEAPSLDYIFGTTSLGQDVFWILAFGVRNSLIMAGLAVLIGRSIAVLLGSFSGYIGGTSDRVLSSIVDSCIVIPRLPLLILISFLLNVSLVKELSQY